MSKQREAFKAFVELQRYCDNTLCEDCCFCLGKDHDNEGYCVFDGGLAQADDEREEISKRVYFLEQMSEEKLPHWIEENRRPKSYMWVCSECGSTAYDMPMYQKNDTLKSAHWHIAHIAVQRW